VQACRHGVVPVICVDIAPQALHPVGSKTLGELAQRPEAARLPVPDIVSAAVARHSFPIRSSSGLTET